MSNQSKFPIDSQYVTFGGFKLSDRSCKTNKLLCLIWEFKINKKFQQNVYLKKKYLQQK